MSAAGKCTLSLLMLFLFMSGCGPAFKKEATSPTEALVPVRFFLPEFEDDLEIDSLKEAIARNLVYLSRIKPETVFQYGPHEYTAQEVLRTQEDFFSLLNGACDLKSLNRAIRKKYQIYRAAGRKGNRNVLFTGYYEPILEASLTRDEEHTYPLYAMPDDLIRIDLSRFNKKYGNERIMARIDGKQVVPYFSRDDIDFGNSLAGRGLEIAWVRDPVDAFFLHIQGSGQLMLKDGTIMRVGYSASNGHPYQSIGNYLVRKNILEMDKVSMQSIRKYLSENPEMCPEVLGFNPSYVFFRVLEGEPVGNINVPLVPGRSIALDSNLFPKGALGFMVCQRPVVDEAGRIAGWRKFSRFVLNQDTGGAIKGAGRADLFWGSGISAEVGAGHMKHDGELYIIMKKRIRGSDN